MTRDPERTEQNRAERKTIDSQRKTLKPEIMRQALACGSTGKTVGVFGVGDVESVVFCFSHGGVSRWVGGEGRYLEWVG